MYIFDVCYLQLFRGGFGGRFLKEYVLPPTSEELELSATQIKRKCGYDVSISLLLSLNFKVQLTTGTFTV